MAFGFIPKAFLEGWSDDALRSWLSPLASAFLPHDILGAAFNCVFLLIAGRFVEKALGPVGLGILFVAGAYAGAAARLLLTAGSMLPSTGGNSSLFAIVAAYFMLYGVPQSIPVPRHLGRVGQVGSLALFWLAIQGIFSLASGSFEVSVTLIDPLGGLLAGVLLADPLRKWLGPKPTSRWH